MTCAYDEIYLEDAMRNLGEMTEYAHDACGIDPDRAMEYFLISRYADRFAAGDPAVICGLSGTELFIRSAESCHAPIGDWPDPIVRYDTGEYYWIGYILAFFQWKTCLSFYRILEELRSADLLQMYPALHTASEERASQSILDLYNARSQLNRLQAYRKRLGMSQSELSKASGVNLRTLQQYESGAKKLSKASAESVFHLARALHCSPDELPDF